MKIKVTSFLLAMLILVGIIPVVVVNADEFNEASTLSEEVSSLIRGAADYAKTSAGISTEDSLFSKTAYEDSYSSAAASDWMAFALSRFGHYSNNKYVYNYVDSSYSHYLDSLKNNVEKLYAQNGGTLSTNTPTEIHRTIITAASLGGNCLNFGTYNNNPINLINDGVLNNTALAKQGINSYMWALIALDTMNYSVTGKPKNTRKSLIQSILKLQLADGSWAWFGTDGDPDLTAMAIIALSPYYYSTDVFTYTNFKTNKVVSASVYSVINKAINKLSKMQDESGAIVSWGTPNSCSTAEVLMALCSVNINITSDSRFIKNGNTLFDAIKSFKSDEGGFSYSAGVKPDSYSNENVTYALVSFWRYLNSLRMIFDMRESITPATQSLINEAQQKINNIAAAGTKNFAQTLNDALSAFNKVPESENRYVLNGGKLIKALDTANPCRYGHNFSKDWVIEKQATYFATGLKSHHCNLCGVKSNVTVIAKKKLGTPTIKLKTKSKRVIVSYTKIKNATKYKLYIKKSGGEWKSISTNKLSKTYKKLTSGKKYYFKVKAVITSGKKTAYSSYSKVKSIKCK